MLPAYNASKTLIDTYTEIPFDIVDEVILVDDNTTDVQIYRQPIFDFVPKYFNAPKTFGIPYRLQGLFA